MVNAKNKKMKRSNTKNSRQIKAKRSWLSRAKERNLRAQKIAQRVILGVILLVSIVVVFVAVFAIFNTPEKVTTRKIEEMARDYYENYYYAEVVKATEASGKSAEEILAKYAETGIPRMKLEQLLLFGNGRYKSETSALARYCDRGRTIAQFYPEAPYGRENYRLEINYACNF